MRLLVLLLSLVTPAAHAAPWEADTGTSAIVQRILETAQTALAHQHYTLATARVNRALALSPNFGIALLARSGIAMATGSWARARADLEHVLKLYPDAALLYAARARIEIETNDPNAALADLAYAATLPYVVIDHDFASAIGANSAGYLYLLRSIALQMKGDTDQALDNMHLALRDQFPYEWTMLNTYCWISAIAGQLDLAQVACDRAIEVQTHPTNAWDSRGYVDLRLKAWDQAVVDYTHAVQFLPDGALGLYGRGIARQAKGDRVGAAEDFAAARSNEPDIDAIMTRLGAPAISL